MRVDQITIRVSHRGSVPQGTTRWSHERCGHSLKSWAAPHSSGPHQGDGLWRFGAPLPADSPAIRLPHPPNSSSLKKSARTFKRRATASSSSSSTDHPHKRQRSMTQKKKISAVLTCTSCPRRLRSWDGKRSCDLGRRSTRGTGPS